MKQTLSAEEDLVLLQRVASQRDEAAFSELFSRYERAAYSIAFNMVGNARISEEVVQEGMLRIWTSARTFRAEGESNNARAWIMKIMTRESLMALRRRRKSSREKRVDVEDAAQSVPEENSNETIDALKNLLKTLAEDDRQLVALHFGAGLSQTEISKELAISQQSISYRLNKILKELRGGLAASGLAMAVPISNDSIAEAVLTGYTPPLELYAQIQSQLGAPKFKTPYKAAGSSAGSYAGAALVCAVLAGGVYFAAKPAATPPTPVPVANVAPTVPAIPLVQPAQFSGYTWTFEKGPAPAAELLSIKGSWKWQPEKKAMLAGDDTVIAFVLPRLPAEPVLLKTSAEMPPGVTRLSYGLTLHKRGSILKFGRQWRQRNAQAAGATDHKSYLIGRMLVEYMNGTVVRVIELEESYENAEIVVRVSNLLINRFDLDALKDADVPAELKDIQKLTAGMPRYDLLNEEDRKKLENE